MFLGSCGISNFCWFLMIITVFCLVASETEGKGMGKIIILYFFF